MIDASRVNVASWSILPVQNFFVGLIPDLVGVDASLVARGNGSDEDPPVFNVFRLAAKIPHAVADGGERRPARGCKAESKQNTRVMSFSQRQ